MTDNVNKFKFGQANVGMQMLGATKTGTNAKFDILAELMSRGVNPEGTEGR